MWGTDGRTWVDLAPKRIRTLAFNLIKREGDTYWDKRKKELLRKLDARFFFSFSVSYFGRSAFRRHIWIWRRRRNLFRNLGTQDAMAVPRPELRSRNKRPNVDHHRILYMQSRPLLSERLQHIFWAEQSSISRKKKNQGFCCTRSAKKRDRGKKLQGAKSQKGGAKGKGAGFPRKKISFVGTLLHTRWWSGLHSFRGGLVFAAGTLTAVSRVFLLRRLKMNSHKYNPRFCLSFSGAYFRLSDLLQKGISFARYTPDFP